MHRNKSGFTIVEVAIAIAVIAVLTTIGSVSYVMIQRQARDSQRESGAVQVTEALEKYYDENGEYPGCSAITTNASDVVSHTLKSIDPSILQAPNDSTSNANSIVCQSINDIPENQDKYSYTGDESDACINGPVCAKWTFSWRKETGGTGSIESRREAEAVAVTPIITAETAGMTQIDTSWTAAAQAVSYELQRSTTTGFETPNTSSHTTTEASVTGLAPNTTYYFRVRSILPSSSSGWSAVASATTSNLQAPSGTSTVTAVMSGTNARGTAAGGSCASGSTTERQIRYQVNGGTWQSYVTGNTRDIAATQGATYTFQSRLRCVIGAQATSYSAASASASVTAPVTAPSGLTVTAVMSGTNARGTAAGGSCASGTTIERQLRYQSTSTATAGSWSGWVSGSQQDVAAEQGWRYTFQQQARCVGSNANSAWVTSSSANIVRPISAVATPTVTNSTSGNTTTWTSSIPTCTTGASPQYQYRYQTDGGWIALTSWYSGGTSRTSTQDTQYQGYQYTRFYQVRCATSHAQGAWSTSSSGSSYTRAIAAPGAPTSFTFNMADSRRLMEFRWTAPTCGPGATAQHQSQSWRDDRPNEWAPWIERGTWAPYHPFRYTGNTPFPVGMKARVRVQYICANTSTGRDSAWGPLTTSQTFTVN